MRAEVGAALRDADADDRRPTAQARLAGAAVDLDMFQVAALLVIEAPMPTEGRAAVFDAGLKRPLDTRAQGGDFFSGETRR